MARALDRRLGIDQFEALRGQGQGRTGVEPFHADSGTIADELAQIRRRRPRPQPFALTDIFAGGDETRRERRTHVRDCLDAVGEMHAAGELVEDGLAFREQQITRRLVAGREHLHVAGPGGVADVDGIAQQASGDTPRRHLGPDAAQPVGANGGQVDLAGAGVPVERRQVREVAPIGMPVEVGHRS